MKGLQYSHQKYRNIRKLSKILFISIVVLAFFSSVPPMERLFKLKQIMPWVFFTYFCIPGLFIFVAPWNSQAWLIGISLLVPERPWDELSKWGKFTIYISSLGPIVFILFVIVFIKIISV